MKISHKEAHKEQKENFSGAALNFCVFVPSCG